MTELTVFWYSKATDVVKTNIQMFLASILQSNILDGDMSTCFLTNLFQVVVFSAQSLLGFGP